MSRSYFLIKAVQLWNWVNGLYSYVCVQTNDAYRYANAYFRGWTDTWIFMKGHTLPLPLSHIKNNTDVTWKYSRLTLTSTVSLSNVISKLSWLSAKIVIVDREEIEYDIDPFLSDFRIQSAVAPNLTTVFLCWCAQTQHWFRQGCIVQFHIIDHNGEDHMLTLGADNHSLVLRDRKIYHHLVPRIDSSSELAYRHYHA